MNPNDKISQALYRKIRNRFSKVQMVGPKGVTLSDRDAKTFNFMFSDDNPSTMVTLSLIEPGILEVCFDRSMVKKFDDTTKKSWFEFLGTLRRFTITNPPLNFDLIDLDRPGLSPTDIQAKIQAQKEKKQDVHESKFSRMSGSKRTSHQKLENHRIKIRHKKIVDEASRGSRSRNIKEMFIENNHGERFRFPYECLVGARAMARTLEEGGDWHDNMGHHVLELANKVCTIREFVREMRHNRLVSETTLPLLHKLREHQRSFKRDLKLISGSKGYHSYKDNIAETYVMPVESLRGMFTDVPPTVEDLLPAIERILGERVVESMIDEAMSEAIAHIDEITPSPPVRPTPMSQPTTSSAAGTGPGSNTTVVGKFPNTPPPGSAGKGKVTAPTNQMLYDLGIKKGDKEQSMKMSKENPDGYKSFQKAFASGQLNIPCLSQTGNKFSADADTIKQLTWLLSVGPTQVKVFVSSEGEDVNSAWKKLKTGFTRGVQTGNAAIGAAADPGAWVANKVKG